MTKKKSTKSKSGAKARSGSVPPYGDPIRQALGRGNLAEMRMNNDLNAQSAFADASVY